MTIRTKDKHIRSIDVNLQTQEKRSDDEIIERVIEGYFVVFNSETELWPGAYEEIAPESLNNSLNNDVRALINHDTSLVLGRNKAGTLDLKVDERGLWGSIKINENDTDAVNLYERVKRGDVDQCSFGFNIISEEIENRDDGTVKWIIKDMDLHEVSVVTFPAYAETGVQARMKQKEQIEQRKLEKRKLELKERLNSVKTINVTEEN